MESFAFGFSHDSQPGYLPFRLGHQNKLQLFCESNKEKVPLAVKIVKPSSVHVLYMCTFISYSSVKMKQSHQILICLFNILEYTSEVP